MLHNMGINPNVNSAGVLPVRPDAGMSPGMMPGGMMMGGMMTASMGMGGVHPNAGPGMQFPPPVNLMQMQPTSMQDPAIVTAGTASAAADPAIITSGPPARGRGNARAAARAMHTWYRSIADPQSSGGTHFTFSRFFSRLASCGGAGCAGNVA